jgi:hypothetical protein
MSEDENGLLCQPGWYVSGLLSKTFDVSNVVTMGFKSASFRQDETMVLSNTVCL